MLDRDTEWRQGGLLTFDSSLQLGLFENEATDFCAVVISHDCDIPSDKEELIEVILGKKLVAVDASLTAAKNIRRIHLRYRRSDPNAELFIELQRSGHRSIKKENFSLADIRKSDQWRLDYISLREIPAAPYLSIG